MSSENIMVTDEIVIIQENYKKRKLKEALTGPLVSTAFHLLLIIIATFIKGETKAPSPQVEITQKVEELVEEPPPPPPPPPPPWRLRLPPPGRPRPQVP